ncbi:hypothetical protein Thiowin_03864 [Thiorhodovibrio winogradskyi]|uniref:Uncharacterized protein n=1 Tax=Thiorhodovibrio winogradskyi TaxID=77007 RepID=A0ABZ0SCM1_9GAMM|nr:hypothetical protein [Thiorhodovibrio winogradskyi]
MCPRTQISFTPTLMDAVSSPTDGEQDDTEAFLAAVAGGLSEDFPDDIPNTDLGKDSPRQDLD